MGRKFWIDCILGTLFIFCIMLVIFNISQFQIFDAFDPVGEALEDMEMTDVAFSQLREDPVPDTNIVIVNIGMLSRAEIARQLQIINQYDPSVIGFDSFFNFRSADTLGDLALSNAFSEVKNLVMVTKLLQTDSLKIKRSGDDIYDSLEVSHELFRQGAHLAFANLDTDAENQEDYKTCRAFPTRRIVKGEEQVAFAVKMAELYNPAKVEKLKGRNKPTEVINYRGNLVDFFGRTGYPNMFYALDVDDVFNENFVPEMIKGKIVLFGFMGSDFFDTSWDDKFFTPLNKNYAGKANPDMYGVVVHANIISMILKEDYVNELTDKEGVGILVAILICFLNVALFSYVYFKLPDWYDGITKLVQLAEIMLIIFLMVIVFSEYSFKLNLVITLAAIALAGDGLEVFYGVVKNLFNRETRKQLFTIRRKKV
ncbi:CHASE2 domain-containing protein [Fulvivirga sp. 29W222]|uniref:CHASE2 domain-containing protein n=1 Tax=Fulvivirga marina TaxID=2494733 RepID=A0A937FYA9_9BACT|nr:CHASE2 domain-containing protein [Fulvivirga marina]MBL6447027.1 CHASE2 domain-containing protein [Fulvivirga marina]